MGGIEHFIEDLSQCKTLKYGQIRQICTKLKRVLVDLPNVIHIKSPITVVGDVHGQWYDVNEIFNVGGPLPSTNYLFLGDIVDRGYYSIEVMSWLFAMKLKYPQRLHIIRGNHESRQITQVYGFYDECLKKYQTVNVWRWAMSVFDMLPLCAVVDNKYFCVHGGLSPVSLDADAVVELNRRAEPPSDGLICDMLWSDPNDDIEEFGKSTRGAGHHFGTAVTRRFLSNNSMDMIVRAHQISHTGYEFHHNERLVTVWSAPRYGYRCDNIAAVMELDEFGNKNFLRFQACPNEAREFKPRNLQPDYFI
ncbi:hypothetical protein KIPB_000728 [Kipferlia bialata]|uniref:Serine/threonine-protein phosphatase n=1 Tax=Kipferlia bialata TaxID=797122 RepID=A0A9K3GEL9_9EUKA|nr:hypothetical protein KIPB_000728 [Kipferlia bialata]|eukprot:g728.t1